MSDLVKALRVTFDGPYRGRLLERSSVPAWLPYFCSRTVRIGFSFPCNTIAARAFVTMLGALRTTNERRDN